MKNDVDFITLLQFQKRPFKALFVPNTVFFRLDEHKNNLKSLKIYLREFKIKIFTVPFDVITVGGEFCETGKVLINLFGDYDGYIFTDDEWFMFKFRLVQVIQHELIHWSQYSMRGHGECRVLKYTSKHPYAAYFSSVDEIGAYSHCVYLELYRECCTFDENIDFRRSETCAMIIDEVFGNDMSNDALRRYYKDILRWVHHYK